MKLAGVLLAGGESRRMGTDKAALIHAHGCSFAAHAVAQLRELTEHVYVVGHARHVDVKVPRIADSVPGSGPRAAIVDAMVQLAAEGANAVIVIAIDMPGVTAVELRVLVHALEPEVVEAACFAGARGLEPLPCALRCTPAVVSALRAAGSTQLRAGLASLCTRTLQLQDASFLRNVNRPADL